MSKQEIKRCEYHTKLTQSVIDELGEGLLHGLTEEEAAENASITAKHYHQWKQAGDAEPGKARG